jgi:2-haloacid dehalogenase
VVSVAEAAAFKPHFNTYAFDCVGAKAAGMHTAFVDRRKRPFGNEYYPPTLVVDDFAHLASEVISCVKGGRETC